MPKMTLTFGKKMEVYERMKEVCKKEGDHAVYESGWSDQRLAHMLGVTAPIIRGIREEMFGKTLRGTDQKESQPGPLLRQTLIRIDGLEMRLNKLEEELGYSKG